MGDLQHFCLRWNNYQNNITSAFENLRDDEDFIDVTLACDGKSLKAHRVVLSACSPYFRELLKSTPCKHPVIVLQDVSFDDLQALVQFIYHGEVNVHQKNLTSFLKTAEVLKVSGLTQQPTSDVFNDNSSHASSRSSSTSDKGPTGTGHSGSQSEDRNSPVSRNVPHHRHRRHIRSPTPISRSSYSAEDSPISLKRTKSIDDNNSPPLLTCLNTTSPIGTTDCLSTSPLVPPLPVTPHQSSENQLLQQQQQSKDDNSPSQRSSPIRNNYDENHNNDENATANVTAVHNNKKKTNENHTATTIQDEVKEEDEEEEAERGEEEDEEDEPPMDFSRHAAFKYSHSIMSALHQQRLQQQQQQQPILSSPKDLSVNLNVNMKEEPMDLVSCNNNEDDDRDSCNSDDRLSDESSINNRQSSSIGEREDAYPPHPAGYLDSKLFAAAGASFNFSMAAALAADSFSGFNHQNHASAASAMLEGFGGSSQGLLMPPPLIGAMNEPQDCPHCHRKFSCYYSLKRHYQDKHDHRNNTLYVCEFCNRRYRTKNSLTTHKSLQHRASSGLLKRLLKSAAASSNFVPVTSQTPITPTEFQSTALLFQSFMYNNR